MLVLAAVTAALYARSVLFGFINFDDGHYISENLHLQLGFTPLGIRWAFTTLYFCNWHPITWLVYLADTSIFGLRAGPLHAINFCLHAANAVLLFQVLWQLTGKRWPAAVIAALFAWHPLRVESVAWISETKDVLAGLFFLLTLLAYRRYVQRPGWLRYAVVAVMYALALMSKPSVVTLPFALLLLDYWPLRRSRWLILSLEKLPLLLMTAGASALIYRAQLVSGALELEHTIPFSVRIANAFVSLGLYFSKTFWPTRLTIFYPHPFLAGIPIPLWRVALSAGVLLVITAWVVHYRRSRPYLIVGWLWFLGTLLPSIGLIQAGEQSMADRYSYLPDMGLLIAVVFLAADLLPKQVFFPAAVAACIALCIATEIQLTYWNSSVVLFTQSNQLMPRNFEAQAILAFELLHADHPDQALPLAQSAVDICPIVPAPYHILGLALQAVGRQHEAVLALTSAHRLDPYDPSICNDMGALLLEMGFNAHAQLWFRKAIDLDPLLVAARQNLAMSLAADGKMDEAIAQWRDAVQTNPKFGAAQGWLAVALERQGDRTGAVEHFSAAINDDERRPEWLAELAWLLATDPHSTTDQIQQALKYATEACEKTHNTDAKALDSRAAALARLTRFNDAVATAQQAIDAANATHDPALAKAIETRMMLYRAGEPFIAAK
jgi:tetratricopeptide (TPR) repeat protein